VPSVYVVDTSSLFELKKFPEDVFPTLWVHLDVVIGGGRLIAPREVFREVDRGDDEVRDWARARPTMFVDLDTPTGECLEEVLGQFEPLRDPVRLGPVFADPLIVALCLARSRADQANAYFVVTEESLRGPGSLRIPNLCQPFGLTAIKLVELFRREGFRY
jgi:Domain of unknown function (DUF4411)